MIEPRPYQTEALKAVLENWHNGVNRQLISLPTGCHAAVTKILMFDGSLKNVEDVAIDDLLMGPDSTPRRVLSLVSLVDGSVLACQHDGNENEFRPVYISPDGIRNLSDEVLPIGYAMGTCEDFARKLSIGNLSLKNAAWRTRPATEKQINFLKKAGISFKSDLTRGEAMSMIEARSNIPATDKQKWVIARYRLHPTPELLTKAQASQIIGKFKQQQASRAS